ncbi:hypothetical protein [Nostoc sp. 'Peltigera membranacea cyanobiont' N6]|uniref:hypothetical protein n=1 Tax=Nostoc sp. 'Peltigera membranacea cyanobiont' N6 TaxID=1261031 RepID=UPI000CF35C4C|nr:hypothetical protein [Nostoc sp. 'Peltigera membranacea cyanobiont' N6]AVH68237.1 hypothetical protein NPM_10160 [Nostoc sp. 'Peltigera membranacea cyanobiont' N6]
MQHFKNHPETISLESVLTLEIILNERDYKEQIIDARLKWISENDPYNPLKNFGMVDSQSEIDFFVSRQQELEQEKKRHIHQRMLQLQEEIQEIKMDEPPELAINLIGPDYVVQDKIQKYREQETRKREAICHDEVQLITGRYNSLKQQCEERISQARANYQAAFRIWQSAAGERGAGGRGAGGQRGQGDKQNS